MTSPYCDVKAHSKLFNLSLPLLTDFGFRNDKAGICLPVGYVFDYFVCTKSKELAILGGIFLISG